MKTIKKNESSFGRELASIICSQDFSNEKSSDFDLLPAETVRLTFRPAAVLVPIVFDKTGPSMVLTRRAKTLKEHPDQIAFPGGKVEKTDLSEMDTAFREVFEEIGLKPENINVLGVLAKHETVSGYSISPFVAIIKHYEKLKPNFSEVSEIFKVPLNFLLNSENMQIQTRKYNGVDRSYYIIPYGPYYIWGATARIIKTLFDLIAKHEN